MPPSIKLSKLNGIPAEGVEIGIPVASDTDVVLWLGINVVGTLRELGLLGLFINGSIGDIEFNMTFFAGGGCENRRLSSRVVGTCSINSVFTLDWLSRDLSSRIG